MPDPLVLDTHTWLWLVQGVELKPAAVTAIDVAAAEGQLWVSAISLWELALLVERQRVTLHLAWEAWLDHATQGPGVKVHPLDTGLAVELLAAPPLPHQDPADRIIACTARRLAGQLATRDRKLLAYAEAGAIQALAI